jgi:hypothetical protein
MTLVESKCGTNAGVSQHKRDGEPLCEACRTAYNAYHRQWEQAHLGRHHRKTLVTSKPNLCRVCGGRLSEHPLFGPCFWKTRRA